MKLIFYSRSNVGPVSINPALVRRIVDHGSSGTEIVFAADDKIIVHSSFNQVVDSLDRV